MGDCKPIAQQYYNAPIAQRESFDGELDWLLEQGYIRPSDSRWASPMVMVRNPDSSARLSVDFKKINEITAPMTLY